MKKITFLIFSIILLCFINNCAGYKPIYSSSNLSFKIEDYSIKGEKRLANLIYRKLNNISASNKNNQNAQGINLFIETKKERTPTVKSSTGKILEYKINLNTNITIKDFLTENVLLNQNFNYSISYKVQDAHSETKKLENKNIENLIDKTYQDILIKISETVALE